METALVTLLTMAIGGIIGFPFIQGHRDPAGYARIVEAYSVVGGAVVLAIVCYEAGYEAAERRITIDPDAPPPWLTFDVAALIVISWFAYWVALRAYGHLAVGPMLTKADPDRKESREE